MPFANMLLSMLNSFQVRLIIAEMLFCVCLRMRGHMHMILTFSVTALIAIPELSWMVFQSAFYVSPALEFHGFNFSFLIVFGISLAVIALCFEIRFRELLFLGAGAFILQNLVYDLGWVVKIIFFPDISSYVVYDHLDYFSFNADVVRYQLICIAILLVGYVFMYMIFIRRWNKEHELYVEEGKMLVFLIITIVLLNLVSSLATSRGAANGYVAVLLAVCSVTLLLIQFNIFDLSRVTYEKEMEQYMARTALRQQRMSEEAVELINIKAHDLKRSLEAIKSEMDSGIVTRELESTEQAVQDYNAIIKTGNAALDTILTEKNLNCIRNGIEFTFMADGSALSFMEPLDIFRLFGNALDNAIEHLVQEGEENRMLSLKVFPKGSRIMIIVENYCSTKLVFDQGLPLTSKEDKGYHGFGMKSIRTIVQKYDGQMIVKQEEDQFSLMLMFEQDS